MKPVPSELVELVKKAAPSSAKILPLSWAYEGEDYNIAVVVPDAVTYKEARQLEGCLIDAVMDYDTAHGTFTLCLVWRESEKTQTGVC